MCTIQLSDIYHIQWIPLKNTEIPKKIYWTLHVLLGGTAHYNSDRERTGSHDCHNVRRKYIFLRARASEYTWRPIFDYFLYILTPAIAASPVMWYVYTPRTSAHAHYTRPTGPAGPLATGHGPGCGIMPCDDGIASLFDYFCKFLIESANVAQFQTTFYHLWFYRECLWDGEGCADSSTCCSRIDHPYFIKDLDTPTSDDIDLHVCVIGGEFFDRVIRHPDFNYIPQTQYNHYLPAAVELLLQTISKMQDTSEQSEQTHSVHFEKLILFTSQTT